MQEYFKGKNILVTGGTGTIGSELVRQLLKFNPARVRVFSRDETKQYELIESLNYPKNLNIIIGDIRDKERLSFAFRDVDMVFHAAAMKHVSISEYNPFEVIKTNIVGSQNVIDAAIEQKVKKVVAISTDKAVNPSGVLGTSKLMMEKLFINANNYIKTDEHKFCCVRFGNILWSRGSVLPSWQQQAKTQNKIRLTDKEMTRFFMSKEQAINLVLQAAVLTNGGEIFTAKMSSISLSDLADIFVEKYFPKENIEIELVGKRKAEKIHEEIFNQSEINQEIFTNGELFIIVQSDRLAELYHTATKPEHYPGFKQIDSPQNIFSKDANGLEIIKEMI